MKDISFYTMILSGTVVLFFSLSWMIAPPKSPELAGFGLFMEALGFLMSLRTYARKEAEKKMPFCKEKIGKCEGFCV